MFRRILPLLLILPLLVAGCKKSSTLAKLEDNASAATPAVPVPPTRATPTPPPAIDRSVKVIVFCYHRFEDNPRDTLALPPAEFRAQMKQLKDDGIAVVAMKDFLTWRRGEKSIPPKSAVITIDDGYVSGYAVAWPILNEFGYPFTMFIYTNYAFVKDIRGRVPGPEVCRACDIAIF
jgi:hypothetical protein